MQRSSRAPVLSATFRRLSCWITDHAPRRSPALLCDLKDLGEAPALLFRDRGSLDETDGVADLGLVALIVRMELRRAAHDLLVSRVRLHDIDLDDDRLVRSTRDDGALAFLTAAALLHRLLEPDDRPPPCRLLAGRRRSLAAEPARGALLFSRTVWRFATCRVGTRRGDRVDRRSLGGRLRPRLGGCVLGG